VVIELKDIVSDMEGGEDKVNFDPQRASYVNDRTDLLNRLLRKHRVDSIDKLISIRNQLSSSVYSKDELELKISATQKTIGKMESDLQKSALEIREARSKAIPTIQKKVVSLLKEVGMKNADFEIRLTALDNFGFRNNGSDSVEFVFSANKGSDLKPLQKVASGGELSRLMLCIKSLLAEKSGLPTLIFDEIDTGVSGEIAFRIGSLIREMSKGRQILVITHLPQMAAHGTDHFRVSKSTLGQKTQTQITRLSKDERVDELARMLSGELLTEAAKANARELLSVND
jgi:DNA repair protein RecN (Recombination protein N)